MTTRVLFLDFDGPLHPATAIQGISRPPDEQECRSRDLFRWAANLESVFDDADEEIKSSTLIAAHSSWRTLPGLSQDLIRHQLGPVLSQMYIGMTRPDLSRWASIQDMVKRGGFSDFLILDDAVNEFPENLPQLVVCSPLRGVSDPDVLARIKTWVTGANAELVRERGPMRMG